MLMRTLDAVRSAKEWARLAPSHAGEHAFGLEDAEPVVIGIFGDSVGCGLGIASVERTFAGVVARKLATRRRVVCRFGAVSGATGAGLLRQIPVGDERYAAVSIGTNDMLEAVPPSALESAVCSFLDKLSAAERVVVMGPGDVASASFVPPALRPLVRLGSRVYEDALKRAVARFPNAVHLGPFEVACAFTAEHFAEDGFHPSEATHALIAEAVLERLGPISPASGGPRATA